MKIFIKVLFIIGLGFSGVILCMNNNKNFGNKSRPCLCSDIMSKELLNKIVVMQKLSNGDIFNTYKDDEKENIEILSEVEQLEIDSFDLKKLDLKSFKESKAKSLIIDKCTGLTKKLIQVLPESVDFVEIKQKINSSKYYFCIQLSVEKIKELKKVINIFEISDNQELSAQEIDFMLLKQGLISETQISEKDLDEKIIEKQKNEYESVVNIKDFEDIKNSFKAIKLNKFDMTEIKEIFNVNAKDA